MRIHPKSLKSPREGWHRSLVHLLAVLLSACTTSGRTHPLPVAVADETGFSITEEVRVGSRIRADFERARQLIEQEQYESGIALLGEVTEAAPHLTSAHINLGIAFARVDDLPEAAASIERALELSPKHPVAHNELGIIQRRQGHFEEARKSYERALAIYPRFHFARRNLAILCDVYLADTACAIEHYERYAKVAPDDGEAAMWISDLRNRIAEGETP